MRKTTKSFTTLLFLSSLLLTTTQVSQARNGNHFRSTNTYAVDVDPQQSSSSLFSFDSLFNFFKKDPVDNQLNTDGIPPFIAKPQEPRRTTDLMRRINNLPGAKLLGHELNEEGECVAQFGTVDMSDFSSWMLCSPSNLYQEQKDENVRSRDGREKPESYVLQIDEKNAKTYCDCIKSRFGGKEADRAVTTVEQKTKRADTINNLINDSIVKLADKFNTLVPKVMYSLTSLEMAPVHISETVNTDVDSNVTRILYQQRSVLSSCAPGEFTGFLKRVSENNPELCSPAGAKRMGLGFIHGRGSSCKEAHMKDRPECAEKGSKVIINPSLDFVDEMIGEHISNSDALDAADTYLNRHHNQLQARNVSLKDSDISPVFDYSSMVRDRDKSFDARKEVESAMMNELSGSGQALWEENHKPIIEALNAILKLGDKADTFTDKDLVIDETSMKHFRGQIAINPFFSKHFPNFQQSSDDDLKKAIISYVKGPLMKGIELVARDPNRRDKEVKVRDVADAMFYTFDDQYQKLVEECEDVQKTLISLCQAADNQDAEFDKVSSFFTDPRLLSLFIDDLEKIHKGRNSETSGRDLASASIMFCQESKMSGEVVAANDRAKLFNAKLENSRYFRRFDRVVNFLDSDRENRNSADYSRTDALNGYIKRSGGNHGEQMLGLVTRVSSIAVGAGLVASAGIETQFINHGDQIEGDKSALGPTYGATTIYSPRTISTESYTTAEKKVSADSRRESSSEKGGISVVESREFVPSTIGTTKVEQSKVSDNNPEQVFEPKKTLPENKTSFSDSFVMPMNPIINSEEENKELSTSDQAAIKAIDPVQAELLAQLEKMREREELMAKELAQIKAEADDRAKEEEARRYENQLQGLQDQIKSLQAQVRQRDEEIKPTKVTPEPTRTPTFGTGLSGSGFSRPASPKSSAAASGSFGNGPNNNQIKSLPTSSPTSAAVRNSAAINTNRSNLAGGNISLTGQTLVQGAVRSAQRSSLGVAPSPRDSSLTILALNADGNVAVRETADPNVVERIVFKEENGEIVYLDGVPVIEKTELVVVEEEELEKLANEESSEEENTREPASLAEEMEELERSTNPRSALYYDLKIMIDENVSE